MEKITFFWLLLMINHLLEAQTPTPNSKISTRINSSISKQPLAAGLVRVGKEGIETGNDKVLDPYFADDFILHAPNSDMNLTQLKAYWVNLRQALSGFTITREQIIVEGNMVGARSIFSGTFDQELKQSPVGVIQPTGKLVKFEVISTFRYNEAGLLAEEWVQNDGISVLKQFGVDILKARPLKSKSE